MRFLALLVLCVASIAVSAPVPPDRRTEFGTNGLLSRADLEKVKFDSHLVLGDDGKPRDDDEEPEEVKRGDKPDAPRHANRYDVAVHLPWAKFRAGEPMPVYLVLRNNRDSVFGLRSSINLSDAEPTLHGGGISFDMRDRATGKSVLTRMSRATNCGGGSLVDVPAFGFYCVKGDLNRLSGEPLAVGEYEVDWRCGRFRAAPIRFTVAPSDAKPAALTRRPYLHFYHLQSGNGPEHPELTGEPLLWPEAQLDTVRTDAMTAALAVGQAGVYAPDVRAIPAADALVEVWAVWKPYRDGDRVSITLRAVPPHKEVRFDELPQLFLQVETPTEAGRGLWSDTLAEAKQFKHDRTTLVTPLTIETRLPEGWREGLSESDTARVAVLVASKPIEFPRGAAVRLEKIKEVLKEHASKGTEPPVWSGVVRSDFTELRVPQQLPSRP